MSWLHIAAILSLIGCCVTTTVTTCAACNNIQAKISSGWVCGLRRQAESNMTYASFRAMPYSNQPVGTARFSEMDPNITWEGYWDASEDGPICPQVDVLYGNLVNTNKIMSEECLHASVHVPLDNSTAELPTNSKLPIVVFIHGGAFEAGSGDADFFGPEFLVSKGVIVITFNFRLAMLGFLSLNSSEIPGNAGLRDCLNLLKWVQANAKVFGGDPDNVTLMGHSSGGTQAHLLSMSNAAQGLFSRLMMMSGTVWPTFYSASQTYAKVVADMYLAQLGINSTDTVYIHKTLTEMPLATLIEANGIIQNQTGMTCFVPVKESSFENVTMILDADPVDLMEQGRGKDYPLLMGFNKKEILAFIKRLQFLDIVGLVSNNSLLALSPRHIYELPSNVSLPMAAKVEERYFKENPTLPEYLTLGADTYFKSGALLSARQRALSGGANVFLYYYTYQSQDQIIEDTLGLSNYTGPVHIEDLAFIMRPNKVLGDHVSFPPTTTDDYMRDWMSNFVVNFARCGDPAPSSGGSLWTPTTTTNLTYLHIDEPYVYNNTSPTQDQQDMLDLFVSLEAEHQEALSASSI